MTTFHQLAVLADGLASEGSRLKKRAAIAEAILRAHLDAPDAPDAGLFAQYLAGQPFAEADPRKLNAGGALLSRAVLAVSGASDAALTAAYRRHGDLGAAAFDLLVGKAPAESTISLGELASLFNGMASAKTTADRAALVQGLLARATALEAKYLLKLMLGDMRIGVKQSLVEEAIAAATQPPAEPKPVKARGKKNASKPGDQPSGETPVSTDSSNQPEEDRAPDPSQLHRDGWDLNSPDAPTAGHPTAKPATAAEVRHAVMLEADLADAVTRAFTGTLASARMRLFHPLGFMLASPVETPEEAVARFASSPEAAADAEVEVLPQTHIEPDPPPVDAEAHGVAGLAVEADGTATDEIAPDQIAAGAVHIHALLEDKFDGMRCQVHCGDPSQPGRVALYSRNREDVTESYPELAEAFASVADGALILDGEILGWDFATERALPFSVLSQRIGRKRVGNELRQQVPVVFMAFDLLYAGGELLLDLPLLERRRRLEAVADRLREVTVAPLWLPEVLKATKAKAGKASKASLDAAGQVGLFGGPDNLPAAQSSEAATDGAHTLPSTELADEFVPRGRLLLSPARTVESADDIDRAYRDARARANEGVMLKAAGSAYQPGRRGLSWVKLKRELATLDVVITGAEFGHGRRAAFLSDYTFAVRGLDYAATGELLNVGKAYSGVTDVEIAELTEWLKAHTLEDYGHYRTVEPLRVLEVTFNNLMRSSRHASGFAMRFPRILRVRDDKPVEEIDTLERVEEIYQSQPDKPVETAATGPEELGEEPVGS